MAPFLCEDDSAQCPTPAGGKKPQGDEKHHATGPPTPPEGEALSEVWSRAARGKYDAIQLIETSPEGAPDFSPRWLSPIAMLNHWTHGGFYGVTACAGSAGAGKSAIAMMTGLRAAIDRPYETVIYLAGEMTENQIKNRLAWMGEAWGYSPSQIHTLQTSRRLQMLLVHQNQKIRSFHDSIAEALESWPQALVIIDSVNAVLTMCGDRGDYWTKFERLLEPILVTRRITEGRLGALILSELNKDGTAKGRWEYKPDLVLHVHATKAPRVVKMTVAKNREKGYDGKLGEFRMTADAQFERVSEVE